MDKNIRNSFKVNIFYSLSPNPLTFTIWKVFNFVLYQIVFPFILYSKENILVPLIPLSLTVNINVFLEVCNILWNISMLQIVMTSHFIITVKYFVEMENRIKSWTNSIIDLTAFQSFVLAKKEQIYLLAKKWSTTKDFFGLTGGSDRSPMCQVTEKFYFLNELLI